MNDQTDHIWGHVALHWTNIFFLRNSLLFFVLFFTESLPTSSWQKAISFISSLIALLVAISGGSNLVWQRSALHSISRIPEAIVGLNMTPDCKAEH